MVLEEAIRVAPAARVAMVGAGQLARMTHQAAIDYGIDLHVLAASWPTRRSPPEPATRSVVPTTRRCCVVWPPTPT